MYSVRQAVLYDRVVLVRVIMGQVRHIGWPYNKLQSIMYIYQYFMNIHFELKEEHLAILVSIAA